MISRRAAEPLRGRRVRIEERVREEEKREPRDAKGPDLKQPGEQAMAAPRQKGMQRQSR